MDSLHQKILATQDPTNIGREGGFEEHPDFRFGARHDEASILLSLASPLERFILIPPELVSDSDTAKRIKATSLDQPSLKDVAVYVVYRECVRGVGHDSTYG